MLDTDRCNFHLIYIRDPAFEFFWVDQCSSPGCRGTGRCDLLLWQCHGWTSWPHIKGRHQRIAVSDKVSASFKELTGQPDRGYTACHTLYKWEWPRSKRPGTASTTRLSANRVDQRGLQQSNSPPSGPFLKPSVFPCSKLFGRPTRFFCGSS